MKLPVEKIVKLIRFWRGKKWEISRIVSGQIIYRVIS